MATIERGYHRGHRGTQGKSKEEIQRGNPRNVVGFPRVPRCPLWLSSCSLPEDRRPHAHTRCSFFDRDFEIVRHAHRENCRTDLRQVARNNAVSNLTELAEILSSALRIFFVTRDGHPTANFQNYPSRHGP